MKMIKAIVISLVMSLPVMALSQELTLDIKNILNEDQIQYVSSPEPIDLLPNGQTLDIKTHLKKVLSSADQDSQSEKEPENPITIEITTSDYGQLKNLLAEKNAETAHTLTITGPIDESDFNAIWECAAKGILRVLDLKSSRIKDNIVPDYALYNTVQFDAGYWLRIKKIILPDEIVRIGKAAFAFMRLEEINIPSSLKELGSTAFGYDRWLNCPINIPEGVTEIKYQTFIDCLRLSYSPKLPSTLRVIGEHAFSNTPFENIVLNDGLVSIKQGAFQSCAITEIVFPNSVTDIGPMAFQLCPRLNHISFPEGIEEIPSGLFSMCNALTKIEIPYGVKNIANSAFMWCTELKDITLPETLESIDTDAFNGCYAEEIVLPSKLKSLGSECLSMEKLLTVYCKSETPPFCETDPSGPFESYWIPNAVLYVPIGCKEKYQDQWQWNMFKEIIENGDFPPSSLDVITTDTSKDETLYDLMGRIVVNPTPNRLYIKNGKKYIAK